jgi:hypothetical protein
VKLLGLRKQGYHSRPASHGIDLGARGVFHKLRGVPWHHSITYANQMSMAQSHGGRMYPLTYHEGEPVGS